MKTLTSLFIFVLALFCVQNVEAGFTNTGKMQSKNLTLSVDGTLDNTGDLIGNDSANISCDTLSGNGLIKAPQITIKAKVFAFTGTIDCHEKCTIITKTPFNEKMFKRKGSGEFVIAVDEKLGKNAQAQSFDTLHDDYNITDELLLQVD